MAGGPLSIGVHPHSPMSTLPIPNARQRWCATSDSTPSARAVGEIGLDYHYDFAPRDVQERVFRAQCGAGASGSYRW